jgi:serine-type D-Ala-D-Ala carboxypeptidase/endopeptidase
MRNLLLLLMMIALSHEVTRASEAERNINFRQEQFSVDEGRISYFAGFPQDESTFPILIHISGSYSHTAGPESVNDGKDLLGIAKMGFGVITLERRGVAHGKDIDTEEYHYFNTPSQRLSDHLSFVKFLKENPPKNWDGKIIVFGVSEGGPIAVKLADKIKAQACITAVGCSEQTFKEFIWKHINDNFFPTPSGMGNFQKNIINYLNVDMAKGYNQWIIENIMSFQWTIKTIMSVTRWCQDIPTTRAEYEKICHKMKNNPTHKKFWYGQTYKYWSASLNRSIKEDFLRLECPVLVIFGSHDVEHPSTEKLLNLAEEKGKENINWLRVDGAGHNVFHPKFQEQVCSVLDDFLLAIKKDRETKVVSKFKEHKDNNFKRIVKGILRKHTEDMKTLVGISIGVVNQNDCKVFNYGYSNLDSKEPVNADTIFEIGSITKVFTAIISILKEQEEKINLEDPINKYFSDTIKVPMKTRKIRLIDLMTHTSGLPRIPDNMVDSEYKMSNPYKAYSLKKLYSFLKSHKLVRNSGEVFEYSNLGYGLLGQILEIQSGQTYETLLQEITIPLHMCDTKITLTDEQKSRFSNCHDEHKNSVDAWDLGALATAGALRSTMNDMLKFAQANLREDKAEGLSLAINKSHAKHNYPAIERELSLGWQVLDINDTQILWHNGGTGGSRSFVGLDKKNHKAVVVLSNTSSSIDEIGFSMLNDRLL